MRKVKIGINKCVSDAKSGDAIYCPLISKCQCTTNCAWFYDEPDSLNTKTQETETLALCSDKIIGVIEKEL
jgi:hypothetical protein